MSQFSSQSSSSRDANGTTPLSTASSGLSEATFSERRAPSNQIQLHISDELKSCIAESRVWLRYQDGHFEKRSEQFSGISLFNPMVKVEAQTTRPIPPIVICFVTKESENGSSEILLLDGKTEQVPSNTLRSLGELSRLSYHALHRSFAVEIMTHSEVEERDRRYAANLKAAGQPITILNSEAFGLPISIGMLPATPDVEGLLRMRIQCRGSSEVGGGVHVPLAKGLESMGMIMRGEKLDFVKI